MAPNTRALSLPVTHRVSNRQVVSHERACRGGFLRRLRFCYPLSDPLSDTHFLRQPGIPLPVVR